MLTAARLPPHPQVMGLQARGISAAFLGSAQTSAAVTNDAWAGAPAVGCACAPRGASPAYLTLQLLTVARSCHPTPSPAHRRSHAACESPPSPSPHSPRRQRPGHPHHHIATSPHHDRAGGHLPPRPPGGPAPAPLRKRLLPATRRREVPVHLRHTGAGGQRCAAAAGGPRLPAGAGAGADRLARGVAGIPWSSPIMHRGTELAPTVLASPDTSWLACLHPAAAPARDPGAQPGGRG